MEQQTQSEEFLILENCVFNSEKVLKNEGKQDLEAEESVHHAAKFLAGLESLAKLLNYEFNDRAQRRDFSQTYKLLQAKESIWYITEIIDAAQEAYPCLFVNGQKYVFSQDVLDAGRELILLFEELISRLYSVQHGILNGKQDSKNVIVEDLIELLRKFDHQQVLYEKLYVFELMLIETDARRYISEITYLERELLVTEIKESARDHNLQESKMYKSIRERFVQVLNIINSIANQEGRGRSDLDVSILLDAERILMNANEDPEQAQLRPALNLAKEVRAVFLDIRELIRRMGVNLDCVNPQLSNNLELAELLGRFEAAWEKGKVQLHSQADVSRIGNFYRVVEEAKADSRRFADALETFDATVFFIIPNLLVLHSLDNNDGGLFRAQFGGAVREGTAREVQQHLQQKVTTMPPQEWQHMKQILYKALLDDEECESSVNASHALQGNAGLSDILSEVKVVGVYVQRFDPAEFSKLVNIVLGA